MFSRIAKFLGIALSLALAAQLTANAGGGKNGSNLTQEQLFELQVLGAYLRNQQLTHHNDTTPFIPPPEKKPTPPPPPEGQQVVGGR